MKTTKLSPKRSHLMMRYHAPLEDFDRHLDWVCQICRKAEIGEVIFIIEPEEYYTGYPTLDRLRLWVAALGKAKKTLEKLGVIMSINPWVTLGHGSRGYPPPKELGFKAAMVGDDGVCSPELGCPADPAWQRYMADSYALIAEAGPDVLWLEDDHRLHNHGSVRFGCFAELTLKEFAQRTGKKWKRAELVKAIVSGRGNTRAQWLKFTGDLWNENIARMRKAVHQANPNVRLAQMTSSMAAHSAEGRRWKEYLQAMGGPHQPITRPHFGPYRQATGFDFVMGLTLFRQSLAFAGRQTRFCPELENGPHSYFSKSRRQTRLMLELCPFFGCRDLTFNFFALAGNNPFNEPWVIEALQAARPRMDALAALPLEKRIERGVHVWSHDQAARYQVTEGQPVEMDSLRPGFDGWARVFGHVGIASTFETPGSVTAVSGDTIRAADDAEIRRFLSGGLLLDGRAAQALQEMGYGQYLGIKTKRRQVSGEVYAIPIERTVDERFGLAESPVMGLTQLGHNWGDVYIYLHELKGGRAISQFLAADLKPIAPAVTLFENSLGGRVAVYPFDFDSGPPDSVRFYHHPRKTQVQAVVRWLNRGKPIVATPEAAQVVVELVSVGGKEVLAIVNLNDDPLPKLSLELPAAPKTKICLLNEAGQWRPATGITRVKNGLTVLFPKPLEPSEAAFLRWK